ncbi:uncharacterized protein [Miscanthus floridulus]|uniref:uncharacterized protein n=1 Tax=Miscanthus floridulus TaxID=154761 RepID=UPI003459E492
MWMSEGFLGNGGPGDRRTRTQIEEDGLDYYEDLVIEPAPEIAGDGSVCKMHDIIRSFAHEIAEEELLVVGPGQNSQLVSTSSAIRQLSVESTELESSSSVALPEWSSISSERHKLLRSLIINGRVKFDAPPTAGAAAAAAAGERLRRLSLFPFPAQTDGDWCSLQELGQLQELVRLEIRGLAAVRWLPRPESTTRSSLSSWCACATTHRSPCISISEGMRKECQRIEEVFDHLRPPRLLECLVLKDYMDMGRRLPS